MSRLNRAAPIRTPPGSVGPDPAGADPSRKDLSLSFLTTTSFWIFAVVVALCIIFGVISPGHVFLSSSDLQNITLDASEGILLALGMTYLLAAGQLDLSVGANLLLSSFIGAEVMKFVGGNTSSFALHYPHPALGIIAGVAAALLVGTTFGFVNGLIVTRLGINAFIATLATGGIGTGLVLVMGNGIDVANIPLGIQKDFGIALVLNVVPDPVIVAAIAVGILWFTLRATRYGTYSLAIGSSQVAAGRAGIDVKHHLRLLYTQMGVLAGVAGVIDIARFAATDIEGHTSDALVAIAATVIGGTSLFGGVANVPGSVAGALLPVVLGTGLVIMGLASFYQSIVVGVILLVAVYLDQRRRRNAEVEA